MSKKKKDESNNAPEQAPETTSTPPADPEAPEVPTAKCASCDAVLAEELIESGKDICPACEEALSGPVEEPEDEADLIVDEPEDPMPPLPTGVMEAAQAFGLKREHVLNGRVVSNGKGGRIANILTQGGKRVRCEVERDGRVILHGPDGVRWVQSAVGGFVARDEQGKVMRTGAGGVLRINDGAQLLHDRDRGIKQAEQPSQYSLR